MLQYLKKYPFSLCVILAILYLSFFTPPKTNLGEIPGFDKFAHTAMYGGLYWSSGSNIYAVIEASTLPRCASGDS